jgi:hypothetical protein
MSTTPSSPITGSLLDGLEPAPPAPQLAAPQAPRKPRTPPKLWLLFMQLRWLRYSLLAALLLSLGIGSYLAFRPVPQPDYANDPIDDVLNYTLLTDEFNNLPIDKRLELLKDLVDRLKTMSADDSSMMAAFAASIDTDKLRKQLEENASRLALDVWDKHALEYQHVPAENRAPFLDKTLIEMTQMMETVGGFTDNRTDEEKIAEARKQAQRDQKMLSEGKGPTAGQLARMADLMRNRVGSHSPPQQQQRGMQLMRDMTRHLRDQNPVTGKPQKP